MDPLYEPQPSGLLLIKPYGACSYLRPPIFATTEHWILDAYEAFIHLRATRALVGSITLH